MSLVPMILDVSSDVECNPNPRPLTTYECSKAPVVLDRGVDILLLSYSHYKLPGKLSISPYSALIRRTESNGGWKSLSLLVAGSRFPVTPRRRQKDSESSMGIRLCITSESRPLVNIFVRKDRHPFKADVFVRLHPALLDWVGDATAVSSLRQWINYNLYPGLTLPELCSIETVSRADLKTDFLVPLDSPYNLNQDTDRHLVTRLKRYGVYTDESTGRFTGFLLGSYRKLRVRVYDKCIEAESRDLLPNYLSHWGLTPDAAASTGSLSIDGIPSTVWRVECQLSRNSLHDAGVTTYEQLCDASASLYRKAFTKSLTMRQTSKKNSRQLNTVERKRAYPTNSFTPFWNSVIASSLSDAKYTEVPRLNIPGVTLTQSIKDKADLIQGRLKPMDTTKTKEIVLADSTNKAIVSSEDFERVSKLKWHLKPDTHCDYAQSSVKAPSGKYTTITLHRFIMSPAPGLLVDHINHDGLDCRRENLRLVTPAQNVHNSRPHKDRKYKGVYGKRDKYYSMLGKQYLGLYKTELEAAIAYNKAAVVSRGDYAMLNSLPVSVLLDSLEGFRVPRWVNEKNLIKDEQLPN